MGEKRNFYVLCFVTVIAFALNMFFSKSPTETNEQNEDIEKTEQVAKDTTYTDKEKFYVLQNEYQQVVFSNIGGAIAELNLSLKNEEKNNSIIEAINLDQKILKESPENSNFPNHKAFIATDNGEQELKPSKGGYTPLLRRDLMDKDGKTAFKIDPNFYAIQLDSENHTVYKVKEFTKDKIVFTGLYDGKKVEKSYSFTKATDTIPYTLEVDVSVEGEKKGLWLSSGVPEAELISSSYTPTLKYLNLTNSKKNVKKISLPKGEETTTAISSGWSANSNGFFGVILDPLFKNSIKKLKATKIDGQEVPSRLSLLDRYDSSEFAGYQLSTPLQKGSEATSFCYYAGPLQSNVLTTVDTAITKWRKNYLSNVAAVTDSPGWFSFIRQPISKLFITVMKFFHTVTKSWGWSIILLTLTLRIIIYPLHARFVKSSKKMSEISPKLKELQAKYKNDPQTLRTETLLLYRNAGANPVSSFLPMLLQIPLFFGIFDVLRYSFDLRGASFIPGWIDNLSAPDVLFSWGYHIPIIGDGLHILPLISGVLMFLQQKLSSTSKTKKGSDASNPLGGNMGAFMCVFFTIMFYTMPAGLNIYMIVSNGFAVLQQYFTNKKQKKPLLSKKIRQ